MPKGGYRPNAGRRPGSGPYGERTTVMRVPQSKVSSIKEYLLKQRVKPPLQDISQVNIDIGKMDQPQFLTLYSTRVSAGMPSPAEDYEEEKLDLHALLLPNPTQTFLVQVCGDSMTGCGIQPGDILTVDRTIQATNGRVVIAVLDGEMTVKRFKKEGSQVFLMPENPDYQPIEILEGMDLRIWGVVTNIIHQL